jgi:hypothetical protein
MRGLPRFACDFPVTILSAGGGRIGEGRFIDISLGGAALETDADLKPGVAYRFFFAGLDLGGRVSWTRERKRGIHFISSVAQEAELGRLLATLKKPAPPRDYWNL